MKVILCVLGIFAFAKLPDVAGQLSVNGILIAQKIRQRMIIEETRSKLENICPGYGVQLENVTVKTHECVSQIDLDSQTLCSVIKTNFEKCSSPIVNLLEECLPTKSRQLPSMIVKITLAISQHICKEDGEHILELKNSCIEQPSYKLNRCIRRVQTMMQVYERSKTMPSPEELCEHLRNLKPCFQSHVESSCGHPITREAFMDIYNEILSQCPLYEKNEVELVEQE